MIVLSGGRQQPQLETSLFLEPLVDQMVKDLHAVVAVEPSTTVYPFVPTLRTDPAVDGHIVTVDDGEKVFGHVAMVLGLRDMLARPGQGGDYGLRSDASDGLIPMPSPP